MNQLIAKFIAFGASIAKRNAPILASVFVVLSSQAVLAQDAGKANDALRPGNGSFAEQMKRAESGTTTANAKPVMVEEKKHLIFELRKTDETVKGAFMRWADESNRQV